MRVERVIDLCESSADEGEPNEVTIAYAGPIETTTGKSNLPDDPKRLPGAKVISSGCFWDSSDGEEPLSLSRKSRNVRRKSKVVTPEESRLKKSSLESDDDFSSDEGQSSEKHHRSKRKQPRTLFSKSSKATSNIRTPQQDDNLMSTRDVATTLRRGKPKKGSSTFGSDESSSDESFPYITVFSKKMDAQPKGKPDASKNRDQEAVVKLDTADEADEAPVGQSTGVNDARNTCHALSSLRDTLIVNPYAKRSDSSKPAASSLQCFLSSKQILQYPCVGPTPGRQYDDIRAKCLLALWKYSRTFVSASYNLPKLDSYCRRINYLALSTEFPIRSLAEYVGPGASFESTALRDALRASGWDKIKTPHCRNVDREGYYSIAEAALVSMLELIEAEARSEKLNFNDESKMISFCCDKNQWVYLSKLIPEIDKRLNKEATPARLGRYDEDDNGEAFYTNPTTRSAEYKQLDQLTKVDARSDVPLLRAHSKNKRLCYELTFRGLRKASFVRSRRFPEPPSYVRTSKLYVGSVQPCFQGICLVVDNREGGGASHKLHSICDGLDMRKVPYIVAKLDIGDYAFVSMDTNKLLPIIIERKSIQDAVQSIWDGRWVSQKQRMYQGQYVFGFDHCRLAYLIEGQVDAHELSDGAMGQTQFDVTRTQLDTEIGNLEDEGFEVLRTNNVNGSIAILVELTKSVAQDYRNGKLAASFTYDEFMRRIEAIPRGVDFSRIARDHRARRISSSLRADEATEKHKCTRPSSDKKETNKSEVSVANIDPGCDTKYGSWTVSQLKEECERHGLAKAGKKSELIARLNGPHPPTLWLQRKNAKLHVPIRHDTCGSAILISIWLHQRKQKDVDSWKGLEKEDIITLAESLKISRDPFTGTGKGLFNYDGWSCMGPLREGQSPLVYRQKGGFFKLTTASGDLSGFRIAEAMHEWCHAHQVCLCSDLGMSP